jgi:hypothetical protein
MPCSILRVLSSYLERRRVHPGGWPAMHDATLEALEAPWWPPAQTLGRRASLPRGSLPDVVFWEENSGLSAFFSGS